MSYLLLCVYLVVLSLIVLKAKFFYSEKIKSHWILAIFLSKFFAGFVLYVVYAYLYEGRNTGDIFKYFDDGNIIFSALNENPLDYLRIVTGIGSDSPHLFKYYDTCSFWLKDFNYGLINDNRILIRFNALVRLISLGNILIHTLFMSFLSFTGLWAIFKVFENRVKANIICIVAAIFYFPSVLFWTSGLLKEGILMFAFGILFYHFNKFLLNKMNVKTVIIITLSMLLLIFSKFYVLVAALPGLLFLVLNKYFKSRLFLNLILAHILFILFAWFCEPIIGLNFLEIITNKQHDFIAFSQSLSKVGSLIKIAPLEPSFVSIIKNTPAALFNSFFRPTMLEANNPFMLMAALENTLIIILIILTFIFFSKEHTRKPLLWFSISFIVILFTLIGLTTPVLGALVRYKAPALPFLGIIFIYFIDEIKIRQISNKLIKWQK